MSVGIITVAGHRFLVSPPDPADERTVEMLLAERGVPAREVHGPVGVAIMVWLAALPHRPDLRLEEVERLVDAGNCKAVFDDLDRATSQPEE